MILLPVVSVGILACVAAQRMLPGQLSKQAKLLQDAKTLSGSVTIQALPGAQSTATFSFGKPNLYRIENADGFVLCDGTNVYRYTKASNSYTVTPADDATLLKDVSGPATWAWTTFFAKRPYDDIATAKTGGSRTIKGHDVVEVIASWEKPEPGSGTFYIDNKTGYAFGFDLKQSDKEWLVTSDKLSIGTSGPDATTFAFTAPDGAKKVEQANDAGSGYAAVQAIFDKNCMPCHGSGRRSGGVDLSSYANLTKRIVKAGDPDSSDLYEVISGSNPEMPRNRPPLSQADQKTIYDWIKNGAKGD